MSINELIRRVKGADEGSRELDAEIVTTLCPSATVGEYVGYEDVVFHAEAIGIPNKEICPFFTTSLDAAMTLVPKGWGWLVSQPNEKAIASGLLKQRTPILGEVQYGYEQRFSVAGATAALALTAAALEALLRKDHP